MPIINLPLEHLLSSTDHSDFSSRRALSDVSLAIAKCKKAIVVSGAGISCSSGIPDFRSADGLYALVKARYPNSFVTGKDLFSAGLFSNPQTQAIFYTFIAELSIACSKAQPTRTHHFIARLESKGKLLRSYTQNVDGLERRLGLESGGRGNGLKKKGTRNVELHGDLGRVRCVLCMTDYEARGDWTEMFRVGEAPDCPSCEERCAARVSRSSRPTPIGYLRPSIVLYDEPHPLGDDIGLLQTYDLSRSPDLLLIMGTSLKVHGFKKLVKDFANSVHTLSGGKKRGLVIYVNATAPSKEWEGFIDYHVQGNTDRWVEKVEEDWKKMRPSDWQTQTLLEDGVLSKVVVNAQEKSGVKGKSKSQGKPVGDIENIMPALKNAQLPTPRPSTSPEKLSIRESISRISRTAGGSSSDLPSSSLSSAPPTPLSPSKRSANIIAAGSPTKKSKTIIIPPKTGQPGTPGQGNLFACLPEGNDWADVDNDDEQENVFGSPKKAFSKKGSVSVSNPEKPIKTKRAGRAPAAGKENAGETGMSESSVGIIKGRVKDRPEGEVKVRPVRVAKGSRSAMSFVNL